MSGNNQIEEVTVMTKIKCDNCESEIDLPELQTRVIEKDVHLVFFNCSQCNHQYDSYYTNKKIRTRMDKIRRIYALVRVNRVHAKHKVLINRIDTLQSLNKKEMLALKNKYQSKRQ
jgi:hypothetical protein